MRSEEQTYFEDDSSGYLISISDMMSGLLFIFIITLVAFIINYQDAIQVQEKVTQELEKTNRQLTNSQQVRAHMLMTIRDQLAFKFDIKVKVDEEHGILHLEQDTINFRPARADLEPSYLVTLHKIRYVLEGVLPCYTAEPPQVTTFSESCDPIIAGKLESVFVEGHTDNIPMGKSHRKYKDNWELSSARALFTFKHLLAAPILDVNTEEYFNTNQLTGLLAGLRNSQRQPVFSVTGYGEGRPVAKNDTEEGRQANRRIDLRFIMTPPKATSAEKEIRAQGVM